MLDADHFPGELSHTSLRADRDTGREVDNFLILRLVFCEITFQLVILAGPDEVAHESPFTCLLDEARPSSRPERPGAKKRLRQPNIF